MIITTTVFILVLCSIQRISCDDIIVKVEQGYLSGGQAKSVIGNFSYYYFKGIPYAKPPIGDLRFKAPEAPLPWEGVRNATEHGAVSPQLNPLTNVYTSGSEDCLFLNVYTLTLKNNSALPVIIYIHGGAFMFGSGNSDLYGPDYILFQEDIVLVTINYRLGPLGFLCLDTEEVPGNAGLKDQVAALDWVQKNIPMFGGDPNQVTLMGSTAGGASVSYHILSPMSKGKFHRAIAMSGSPTCDWAWAYRSKERALTLSKTLGCYSKNMSAVLTCLQNVTYDQIVQSTPHALASENITAKLFKMESYSPVIEKFNGTNNFIYKNPMQMVKDGEVNNVTVMAGYNSKESVLAIAAYVATYLNDYNIYPELFVPSKALVSYRPNTILKMADQIISFYFGNKSIDVNNIDLFVNYASNASIAYDVQAFYRALSVHLDVNFYKLSCNSSRNYYGLQGASYKIWGPAHFDDVFYTFPAVSLNLSLDSSSTEYTMVQNFTKAITDFAKYGNPGKSLNITWPKFNKSAQEYVKFENDVQVDSHAEDADVQFWMNLLNTTECSDFKYY